MPRQKVPRTGRSFGQFRFALPSFTAGAPAQRCPVGICPVTAEPGATSARLPTLAPGKSMLRVPTTACAPTLTGPITSRSPSSQYPDRSTSDSTAAPRPSRSTVSYTHV